MQFQRNIFYRYPANLLPQDLAREFSDDAIVTVIVETEGDFAQGSIGIERIHEFLNGKTIQVTERAIQT